ncbi:ArsR family transcriptional regulator [candidate division KSB1 bacterium]|nr:MAG: ArsR family transcriptional regulator [candidate division KSB1 bacterium]
MRELIKVLKALSDEVRLRILKILQERDELCVCEIMQALDISQTRTSRNLGILKDAGFVTDRREGVWIYYSISDRKINEYHSELIKLLSKWLNEEEVVQKDKKRLKRVMKLGLKDKCMKNVKYQERRLKNGVVNRISKRRG